MNTNNQSHTNEHHRCHWDFAKLLTTLSVAFLTVVAALGGLATDNSWLVQSVLVGQLLSLFCGFGFLYIRVRSAGFIRETSLHAHSSLDGVITVSPV